MPNPEQDLVDLGSRFPTQRLIEQGAVSAAVARAHAAELAKWFPTGRVDEIDKNVKRLRELYDEQVEKKFAKATGNVPVTAAAADGKRLVSDIIAVADNAFDMQPEIADQFHQGGKIGRSIPKLVGRIETLLTLASKFEERTGGFTPPERDRGAGGEVGVAIPR